MRIVAKIFVHKGSLKKNGRKCFNVVRRKVDLADLEIVLKELFLEYFPYDVKVEFEFVDK